LPDLHQTAFSREHNHKRFVSRAHDLKLVFDGHWSLDPVNTDAVAAELIEGQTVVTLRAQHGQSYHFQLSQVSESRIASVEGM